MLASAAGFPTTFRSSMKKLLSLMALGQALCLGSACAASHTSTAPMANGTSKEPTRMATCSKQAEGRTGDRRSAFLKTCLAGESQPPLQAKLSNCNSEAKGMEGDQRKVFMRDCLKSR
jgi:uncharacterized low-complexity protein